VALAQEESNVIANLSLEEAIAQALEHHPSLIRAKGESEIARARVGQARSGQMPMIAVQGMISNGPLGAPTFGPLNNPALNGVPPIGPTGLTGDPVKRQFGASLNIQGTLLDFGRTRNLVDARRNQVAAAQADIQTQRAIIVLSVQQAYYTALRQQQILAAHQANLRQREATFRQAKLFVDGELKAGIDLQTAKVNVAEAQVALLAAENEFQIALASLSHALGKTEQKPYRLTPLVTEVERNALQTAQEKTAMPTNLPVTLEEAITLALKQRSEIESLHLQIVAAERAIDSIESETKPRVDAVGSVGAINPSQVITNNQIFGVAAILTIPLYGGGMVEGRITEEQKKRDVLTARHIEQMELIKLQVTRAWLNYKTRQAQIAVAQEQVRTARNSTRLAGERYRLQLGAVVELTDAEATLARAEAQWINAIYDEAIGRAELNWAVGETHRLYSTALETQGGKKQP
jgi:outer membrane protein